MGDETRREFDFVIIGAGSAGCVLANRLTANGRYSVALVEAGGTDRRFFVQMPLGYGKTFYDPTLNWGYRAEPDPGLAGQSDYWPRGKLLGGSSSINAMVWIRGNRRDYDDWAAEGNPGWSYEELLPHFKAIEHNEAGGDDWRGTSGELHISDMSNRLHPLATRFIRAGLQAGLTYNPDFNGPEQDGVGVYQITTRNGWRMSSAKAFLRPALKRSNLTLFTSSHATRLIVENHRVTGVEIHRSGQQNRLIARREVILSAGAVNTPQLLQLSGIGPASHLKQHGIDVVADLPAVGAHMQDHIGINYTYRATIRSLNEELRPWWGKLQAGLTFLALKRGPLSMSLNQGGGFWRSRPDLDRPNIQLYLQAISTVTAKSGSRPLMTPDPFPAYSIGLSNCKPTSRGSIMLASPDPFAAPRITANALSTDVDKADMLAGVKMLRHLARQQALAEVTAEELKPGPDIISDLDLMYDFQKRSGTVYHVCGTCRMGKSPDTAVVDSRLRLHSLEGLRIADASIFPSVVSGNTNATVMMVAAKAAALILEEYG